MVSNVFCKYGLVGTGTPIAEYIISSSLISKVVLVKPETKLVDTILLCAGIAAPKIMLRDCSE
jgi:hypothetical protein